MGSLAFSSPVKLQKSKLLKEMTDVLKFCLMVGHCNWFRYVLYHLPGKLVRPQFYWHAKYTLEARKKKQENRKDLFWYLNGGDREDGGEELDFEQQVQDGVLVLVAGGETTSISINFLTYQILKNPSVLSTLRKELDEAFPLGLRTSEDFEIDWEKLLGCEYLNACVKESLRLMPPTNFLPRTVGKGGTTICGEFLPEGTEVMVPVSHITLSPSNFTNPKSFIPERWLPEPPSSLTSLPNYKFNTLAANVFGGSGHFACVGKNFALEEMRAIVGGLIRDWNVEIVEDDQGDWNGAGKQYFTVVNRQYQVKMSKRG